MVFQANVVWAKKHRRIKTLPIWSNSRESCDVWLHRGEPRGTKNLKAGGARMAFDLVTGGAGFIGSHLVDRLIADGRRVRVLDNFSVGRRANLAHHGGNPRLEIIEADIADTALVARAAEGADRIFHLAARADIVPSIQEPE